ncbi:hypothetical protein AAVH_15384 [Aphelenchoides avenae]|nr:hypothetical protein AAVH_15384 [Aphelenchus avenae]
MSASALPSTETSSDDPTGAKRPKLESDDDEDISIVEEINVRTPQIAGGNSHTAGPSQLSDGEADDDNQDSKLAEFRNKMLKYEAEASHLRTQLKREQEKAQKAVAVREHYEAKYEEERKRADDAEAKATAAAHQKVAAGEKKAKDLQKQCDRLETKVQSKEAEIDFRDKELGNVAKELNVAQKKAEDAEKDAAEAKKKTTDDEQKAAEADAKMQAAEKEASDLKQELEELKKSKPTEEPKLSAKVNNRMACTETCKMSSSSPDEQLVGGLNEANGRIAQQEEEITKLRADNDKLKKDLTASKTKATRMENAQKKLVKEKEKTRRLEKEIEDLRNEVKQLKKQTNPETVLDARLETAHMQQALGRFDRIADKITMKFHQEGVAIMSNPSRPTLPKVLLELKPSFFGEFSCYGKYLVQAEYSLLSKGFATQAEKEQCRLRKVHGRMMLIEFKSAAEQIYDPVMTFVTSSDDQLEWTLIEDNAPYACTFEMNSFVLAQAAQKLSPVLLDFNNRGQPDAVVITDSDVRLDVGQGEHLWRSLPGENSHANDFKAEFSSTTPNTKLRIYVDPKYLRRCVMASSDAGSKTVEVSVSVDILRLRYGNEHFSLTYYIPTVTPADGGERCYSPIEFGTEIFEI